jgi:hypothetical protein
MCFKYEDKYKRCSDILWMELKPEIEEGLNADISDEADILFIYFLNNLHEKGIMKPKIV